MAEDLVAIIAILTTVGLPILTGLLLGGISMRSKHRERMGLINQGIIPPDTETKKADPNRMGALRNGLVLLSIGIGLGVGFFVWSYLFKSDEDIMIWVFGSSVLLFLGLGYLGYFYLSRKMSDVHDKDTIEREQDYNNE